ncbi:MAG: metallophosphoesterase [Clostridia bacterium]|nr:metallophosphoesterase [Clostridia bacterium]
MRKQAFLFLLTAALLLSGMTGLPLPVSAADSLTDGIDFDGEKYVIPKKLEKEPRTFEAWLYLPRSISVGGEIIGAYAGNSAAPAVNFGLVGNGNPRIYLHYEQKDGSQGYEHIRFKNVDVRTGGWAHLAVVMEENQIHCYLNGVKRQTVTAGSTKSKLMYHPDILENTYVLAGDNRSGNTKYFLGRLKSVTLYSDARTADEVKADMTAPDLQDENVLLHYGLQNTTLPVTDETGNGYDAGVMCAQTGTENFLSLQDAVNAAGDGDTVTLLSAVRLQEKLTVSKKITLDTGCFGITAACPCPNGIFWEYTGNGSLTLTGVGGLLGSGLGADALQDYAYSFAVVGDTQYMTKYDAAYGKKHLNNVYDWILENAEEKKIRYVFGLGDITDSYAKTAGAEPYDTAAEWQVAYDQISRLDGKLPYSLVRGNHDNEAYMDRYFATDAYRSQFTDPDAADNSVCFYETTSVRNAYNKFTVGETKYLLLLLDDNAPDAVLQWAGKIIDANPDHRVIVTTHTYLGYTGDHIDASEGYAYATKNVRIGENNGQQLWEKLISQHRNIFLVLCGHDYKAGNILTVKRQGVHGNTVTEMLICPQSLDRNENNDTKHGMVAMLYFSEDGYDVRVEYISTVKTASSGTGTDAYIRRSQNSFAFNLISRDAEQAGLEYLRTENGLDLYVQWMTNGIADIVPDPAAVPETSAEETAVESTAQPQTDTAPEPENPPSAVLPAALGTVGVLAASAAAVTVCRKRKNRKNRKESL